MIMTMLIGSVGNVFAEETETPCTAVDGTTGDQTTVVNPVDEETATSGGPGTQQ